MYCLQGNILSVVDKQLCHYGHVPFFVYFSCHSTLFYIQHSFYTHYFQYKSYLSITYPYTVVLFAIIFLLLFSMV
ncbi:hypothetical protein DICVIV_10266 [Dictyocaulus viviparus]|uniref:Uncharacterized protein n=1 Tax=Dictyocaulus viviparus TaxID=29172 RepID=A0A0D8XIZ8_DICVI|nr:hypothetical protein DICVIV_10266 [Dictyocaulus viviparus]